MNIFKKKKIEYNPINIALRTQNYNHCSDLVSKNSKISFTIDRVDITWKLYKINIYESNKYYA